VKVKILESANQDLLDGFNFYECQDKGLGVYFIDTLFSDIDSLIVYAGIHPVYFNRYHRLLSRRFPFAVYYRIEEDRILISAVLDCRGNPAWIITILESEP
jgi:hypothetical protein